MAVATMKPCGASCRLLLPLLLTIMVIPSFASTKKKTLLQDGIDFVPDCRDEVPQCEDWAKAGYCDALPQEIKPACRKSCPNVCDDGSFEWGEFQQAQSAEDRLAVSLTLEYLHTEVYRFDLYEPVRHRCINKDKQCAHWASEGECEGENEEWMLLNCAPSCHACFDLDVGLRCYWDPKKKPQAIQKGGLDKMFERITTDIEFQKYNPTILSRPSDNEEEEEDGPWVVTLDDFISEEECDTLIENGAMLGYKRSEGQAVELTSETGEYVSEVSDYRTSYQAWCEEECYEDEIVEQVMERMAHVTGIPEPHYEYLQLLKYNVGQYYKIHHDYIDLHYYRPMGPRILTFFLYLNDVEEGGGTRFPDLNVTVMPKRGRALIWPSVLNENPMDIDPRTDHEALPVIKGQKYGANAWLHLGDFKAAYDDNCVF